MIPVLEIGGTHVTAALVDPLDGRVTGRTRTPLDADGDAEAILDTVRRCADGLPVPPGARWGVAVPGPFDYAKGVALFEDVGKFDALYGMDVRAALLRGLRHRPGDVVFVNDAHAFLTGEWSAGTVRGHRRAVGITLGTGVGSAFLADGRIRDHGPGLPPEGRMDLTEIAYRPLEETISRRAILTRYGDPRRRCPRHRRTSQGGGRAGPARTGRRLHRTGRRTGPAHGGLRRDSPGRRRLHGPLLGPRRPRTVQRSRNRGWPPDDPHARALKVADSAGDAALVGAARATVTRVPAGAPAGPRE